MSLSRDFPSLITIESCSSSLEPLLEDFLFVGGATTGFYLTDLGRRTNRETTDVDIVVEATTRADLAQYDQAMRAAGFREDMESGVICRWVKYDLVIDLMPTGEGVFGFKNRWFAPAFASAMPVELPSGRKIRIAQPPFALAFKLEAFADRGRNDFQASPDFEDIVALIDCRPTLGEEVSEAPSDLRQVIAECFRAWLASIPAIQGIAAHLPTDEASQARRPLVLERMRAMAMLNE